ncbi:hypothetical protein FACS1894113_1680 [Alphaproteobacteria bacterium]|nr:hypothetical protein FACS1894113_1680 [Alphaproteobacteria bacterium]
MAFVLFFAVHAIAHDVEELKRQVESYINNVCCIASDFIQLFGDGKCYSGKFYLLRKKGDTKVKIDYVEGIKQKIFINNGTITILQNGRMYNSSIEKMPIYSVLSGRLNLKNETVEIIENSDNLLRIKIKNFRGFALTLVFSKYEKTKNIQTLEAWIVDDGNVETLFSLNSENRTINDEKSIPKGTFSNEKAR